MSATRHTTCPPWCIEPKLKMTGNPLHTCHVGNIGQATIRPGITVEVNVTLDNGDDEAFVSLHIGPDDQLQLVELVTEYAAALGWALANLTPREIRKFAEQLTAAAALGEAT